VEGGGGDVRLDGKSSGRRSDQLKERLYLCEFGNDVIIMNFSGADRPTVWCTWRASASRSWSVWTFQDGQEELFQERQSQKVGSARYKTLQLMLAAS
jgi:hypothetical protein